MKNIKKSSNIDFSNGPVWKCIVAQAVPLTIAQLVQLLYNVVDRIYLGHMGDGNSMALTGVGLTFPIITLIMAFTALFGNGGVPLFSMARGAEEDEKAGGILGNSFALLLCSAVVLTVTGYLFSKPILFAFGIGAVCNIILDPVFIYGLDMGVSGAALATIISQMISAVWVLRFLTGKHAVVPLCLKNVAVKWNTTMEILKLGASNFVMQGTTCLVQVVCNATLQEFGGDLHVGIMTVTNSVREIFILPIMGIVNGAQPVISYNYGAKQYKRVLSGIRFNTMIGSVYTMIAWLLVVLFPRFWFGIFSDDMLMIEVGMEALKIYFFGFVFMAEPISNVIGGFAAYLTMRMTVYKEISSKVKTL